MEEYEEDTNEDIKWRTLGPKDRVKFLKNLFSDEDWYDGVPFFQGGDTNPDFQTICDRSGAPMAEVKRYYASWLDRQGFDPKRANQLEKDKNNMVAPPTAQQTFNATAAPPPVMPTMPMDNAPDPMDQMMMNQMQRSQGDSGASNMMFMMHFNFTTKDANATTTVPSTDDDAARTPAPANCFRNEKRTDGKRPAVYESTNNTSS